MNAPKFRTVGLTRFPFHDMACRPIVHWLHRCQHRPGYWLVLRARIRLPARDEWVYQSDLPGGRR